MKLYAFAVREDEKQAFYEVAQKNNLDIELHSELLTAENISTLEQGSGVTTLGMTNYGKKELKLLAERGVNYLSTRTIGYNHIDIQAAKELGVHVCHAAYAPDGVADYTIMMILLCLRKYKQSLWRSQVNDYSLEGLQGREMRNLTIGVMGTGRIGATVIKDLSGFGCKILAYDVHKNPAVMPFATYVPLEEIYRSCDVITLHMPQLPETEHIINSESIAKMKKGVVLINCARGGLMDVKALINGIESEQIGALGLDCLENEEVVVHKNLKTEIFSNRDMAYLRQFKNVYHTQHMAFYTDAAVYSMVEYGVLGLVAMAQNKPWPTQLS
jgi:D-lactate dehydrogenase